MDRDTISSSIYNEIINFMGDHCSRNIPVIKEELKQRGYEYTVDYQESHLSGVLYSLKRKGILQSVGRGTYLLPETDHHMNCSADSIVDEKTPSISTDEKAKDTLLTKSVIEVFSQINDAYDILNKEMDKFTIAAISSSQEWEQIKCIIQFKEDLNMLLEKYRTKFPMDKNNAEV